MAKRKMTAAEIDAELDLARKRTQRARASGHRIATATYNARAHHVLLTLTSGVTVGIPIARIPHLADATSAQLKRVTVTPTGSGVSWDELDVDLTIEGLLVDALGPSSFARALGRVGGKTTSTAKAAAARENGRKGGRPKKHAA